MWGRFKVVILSKEVREILLRSEGCVGFEGGVES